MEENGRMRAAEHGYIRTLSSKDMSERLDILYRGSMEVILRLAPDVVALERLFFNTNLKTAVSVGQVPWEEYAPLEVKQAVAGNGNAGKEQVQYMVGVLLGMEHPPSSLHACDALAMAICHLHMRKMKELTGT